MYRYFGRGFDVFSKGRFDNGGDNLYVTAGGRMEMIHNTDVNGDGANELVVATAEGIEIRNQDALERTGEIIPLSSCTWIHTADLNGDGKPEIVFNNTHTGWSRWDPKFPLYVYLGNEHKEYSTKNRLDLPTGYSPDRMWKVPLEGVDMGLGPCGNVRGSE